MPQKDPDKRRESVRRWRENNPEHYKELRRKNEAAQRDRRRALLAEHKNVPCARCGKRYPSYVMDFHHRDPTEKIFSIGRRFKSSLAVILEEIAKCDVLCSNCHRIVEYESMEQPA